MGNIYEEIDKVKKSMREVLGYSEAQVELIEQLIALMIRMHTEDYDHSSVP